VPLFESLDNQAANAVSSLLSVQECDAGHILFQAGDAGDSMYLIEDGKVQISMRSSDGEELILAVLAQGDFFGEMALIDNSPRTASAVAKTACRLAPIDQKRFHFLVQQTPNFATHVMKVLAARLRRMNEMAVAR